METSERSLRWPVIVGPKKALDSDRPREWLGAIGLGPVVETEVAAERGEARPSVVAETGVAATEERLVVDPVRGVYGVRDADWGDMVLSSGSMRADFGGTLGGSPLRRKKLLEICFRMVDDCDPVVVGMTRGARSFGDIGCPGDPDLLRRRGTGAGLSDRASDNSSGFSSNAGPAMRDNKVSPKTLCFHE